VFAALWISLIPSVAFGGKIAIAGRHLCVAGTPTTLRQNDSPLVTVFVEHRCTNHSTGPTPYMDGAKVRVTAVNRFDGGEASGEGNIHTVLGEDSTTAVWKGRMSSLRGDDGLPVYVMEGTWETITATGRWSGAVQRGTWRGQMRRTEQFEIDWQGSTSE
jgi:hypothetical protein